MQARRWLSMNQFQLHWCRREFLRRSTLSLGAMALGFLDRADAGRTEAHPTDNALAPRRPHFAARAKHVIYLHMIGAPSHLDLFDYKPALVRYDSQTCPEEFTRGRRFAFIGGEMHLAGTQFRFRRHGKS